MRILPRSKPTPGGPPSTPPGQPPGRPGDPSPDQPERLPQRWVVILGFSAVAAVAVGLPTHSLLAGVTIGIMAVTLFNAIIA